MSDTSPKNQRALQHNAPPALPPQAKHGERLFEFVRASDRAPMSCVLLFHARTVHTC